MVQVPIIKIFEVINMRTKYTLAFVQDCIKLNAEGLSLTKISELKGCERHNLARAIRFYGFEVKPPAAQERVQLPAETIAEFYLSGSSLKELAQKYGVARDTIAKRLTSLNINLRTPVEASAVRYSKLTFEERQKLVKNANIAVRNKPAKRQRLKKAAVTRNVKPAKHLFGFGEDELYNLFINHGFSVEKQAVFDIYNIDLLVNRNIAVEISCSTRNPFRIKRYTEKIKKLTNSGYGVLWIFAKTKDEIILNLDNLITYFKATCTDPTFIGQYRVIGCTLQHGFRARNNRGQFTFINTTIKPQVIERTYNTSIGG